MQVGAIAGGDVEEEGMTDKGLRTPVLRCTCSRHLFFRIPYDDSSVSSATLSLGCALRNVHTRHMFERQLKSDYTEVLLLPFFRPVFQRLCKHGQQRQRRKE